MRKIPSTMASQHPDHASRPYWHSKQFISTQFEAHECFLTFSELGADEYKWDWEGKLVDESVIERLLGEHFDYFKRHPLGVEKFLTFRLPNPKVETEFRIGRAFMGILAASALAKQILLPAAPIFEVILPMTQSAQEMINIQEAFAEIASLKHHLYRFQKNNTIKYLEIIPLFEQVETIINSDQILSEYLQLHKKIFGFQPAYLRPYLARSDPALNSGLVAIVLGIKIALSNYLKLAKQTQVELYPIIGSASLPFRGGLTPETVDKFIKEYRGIKTVLLQSAFRYDYPKNKVKEAIVKLEKQLPILQPESISDIEKTELRKMIKTFELFYKQTIEEMADLINQVALSLPKRRERVQHTGLFGYSRGVGRVKLPRAIGFTGALYSIGIPPELIGTGRGLKAIQKSGHIHLLEKYYLNIKKDLERAGRFLNKKNLQKLTKKSAIYSEIIKDVHEIEKYLQKELRPVTNEEKAHWQKTSEIYKSLESGEKIGLLLQEAAVLRKSLG